MTTRLSTEEDFFANEEAEALDEIFYVKSLEEEVAQLKKTIFLIRSENVRLRDKIDKQTKESLEKVHGDLWALNGDKS